MTKTYLRKPLLLKTKVSSIKFVIVTVIPFNLLLLFTLYHFERSNELIITISGAAIILGLMQISVALFFKYLMRGMYSLVGINFRDGILENIDDFDLRNIWIVDESFRKYRWNMVKIITHRNLDIIATIFAIIIGFGISIVGIIPGEIIAWGDDPYWVPASDPYAIPVILATFLITTWFLIGWISGMFVLIFFVMQLSRIGKAKNLTILEENETGSDEIITSSMNEGRQLAKSLYYFKIYVKPIIDFTTPISVLGLIIIAILGVVVIGIFYIFFDGVILLLVEVLIIGGMIGLSVITIGLYFVYPQWSFYRILTRQKKGKIQNLTISIERKSILWHEMDKMDKLSNQEIKNQLNTDLQLLFLLYDEIKKTSPWIANYSQLASIIGTGSITIMISVLRIFVFPLLI